MSSNTPALLDYSNTFHSLVKNFNISIICFCFKRTFIYFVYTYILIFNIFLNLFFNYLLFISVISFQYNFRVLKKTTENILIHRLLNADISSFYI